MCPAELLKSPAREIPTYRKARLKPIPITSTTVVIVTGPCKLTRRAEPEKNRLASPLKMK
jgi:hypothetical protein